MHPRSAVTTCPEGRNSIPFPPKVYSPAGKIKEGDVDCVGNQDAFIDPFDADNDFDNVGGQMKTVTN